MKRRESRKRFKIKVEWRELKRCLIVCSALTDYHAFETEQNDDLLPRRHDDEVR